MFSAPPGRVALEDDAFVSPRNMMSHAWMVMRAGVRAFENPPTQHDESFGKGCDRGLPPHPKKTQKKTCNAPTDGWPFCVGAPALTHHRHRDPSLQEKTALRDLRYAVEDDGTATKVADFAINR